MLCSGARRRSLALVLATTWSFSVTLCAAQDGDAQLGINTAAGLQELRQAAEKGDPEAQFRLGVADSVADLEAVAWLRTAASQGHLVAQVTLAARYRGGVGVPQDYGEAIEWYRRAGEQDVDSEALAPSFRRVAVLQMQAIAQHELGGLYLNGLGVPRNYVEAARWYRLAANHGVVAAQIILGVMYVDGKGVQQDYVAAHTWFNLAAARGNDDARELRDEISESMTRDQVAEAQRAASEWLAARQ